MASFSTAPLVASRVLKKDMAVPRGASLPANCVKCGATAELPWRKKFYWHPSWVYIFVVLNLLIYVLIAILVRKKMELNVPLCEVHHGERKRYNILAAVMLLGCVPVGITIGFLFAGGEGPGWAVGTIMFVTGLVFLLRSNNYMSARKIDEQGGVFRGAKEPFLQLLSPQI